jgi:hypothetical protein
MSPNEPGTRGADPHDTDQEAYGWVAHLRDSSYANGIYLNELCDKTNRLRDESAPASSR